MRGANDNIQCTVSLTGSADFVDTDGIDCSINLQAVEILWAVNIAFTLLSCFRFAPVMRYRIANFKEKRSQARTTGGAGPRKFRLRDNKGLLSALVLCFVAVPT